MDSSSTKLIKEKQSEDFIVFTDHHSPAKRNKRLGVSTQIINIYPPLQFKPLAFDNQYIIGICFDLYEINSPLYGYEAYKIFFKTIDTTTIPLAWLLDGDTNDTLKGFENIYCIAVWTSDFMQLYMIWEKFCQVNDKRLLPIHSRFISKKEPLVHAVEIDFDGGLTNCDTRWIVEAWKKVEESKNIPLLANDTKVHNAPKCNLEMIHYHKAIHCENISSCEEAIKHYRKEIQFNRFNAKAFYNLAILIERSQPENIQETIDLYETAAKLNLVEAMYNLSAIYNEKKQWENGFKWIEKAYSLNNTNTKITTRLAWYKKEGKGTRRDILQACKLYEEAINLDKTKWVAQLVYLCLFYCTPPEIEKASKYIKQGNSTIQIKSLQTLVEETENRSNLVKDIKNTTLKDYKIIKRLGAKSETQYYGGSAAVYLAEWKGSLYALKILYNKDVGMDDINIELFHPFIVSPLHTFVENLDIQHLPEWTEQNISETQIMVYYYYKSNLDQFMQQKTMISEHQVIRWAIQLTDACVYLSNIGIVHRDLKLDNILISSENNLAIADFGFCYKCKDQNFKVKIYDALINNQRGGAKAFLPPEICMPEGDDVLLNYEKSDIFGVGLIIYYLLNKTWPFGVPNPCYYKDSLLQPLNGDYPKVFEEKLKQMLKIDFNERFSAEEAHKSWISLLNTKSKPKSMNLSLQDYAILLANIDVFKKEKLAKEIGQKIYEEHGHNGMVFTCDLVYKLQSAQGRCIEKIWDGIGRWSG